MASPTVKALGHRIVTDGGVTVLARNDRAIMAHVTGPSGRRHLVGIADPGAHPESTCTCNAGRHDTYCQHVHALALTWEADA